MMLRRALLPALLAAASLAAPAAAESQNLVYRVSASGNVGWAQVEATCVFVADRWTADYGPTRIEGVAVSNGAISTSVTCEMFSHDFEYDNGRAGGQATPGPVGRASGYGGFIGRYTNDHFCVTATAQFELVAGPVSTNRVCSRGHVG